MEVVARPILPRERGESVGHTAGTVEDITARKQTEEQRARCRRPRRDESSAMLAHELRKPAWRDR